MAVQNYGQLSNDELLDRTYDLVSEGSEHRSSGDLDGALRLFLEAVAAIDCLRARTPDDSACLEAYAYAYDRVGWLLRKTGDPAQAERYQREALTAGRRLRDAFPRDPETLDDLAIYLLHASFMKSDLGDLSGQEALTREYCDVVRAQLELDPDDPKHLADLSTGMGILAEVLSAEKKTKESAKCFMEAMDFCKKLLSRDPQDRPTQLRLTQLMTEAAETFDALGLADNAEALRRQALRLGRLLVKAEPDNTDYINALLCPLKALGAGLRAKQDTAGALACALEAAQAGRNLYRLRPETARDCASLLDEAVDLLRQTGDASRAVNPALESCRVWARIIENDPQPALVQCAVQAQERCGDILCEMGQKPISIHHYNAALELRRKTAWDRPRDADAQLAYVRSADSLCRLMTSQFGASALKERHRIILDSITALRRLVQTRKQYASDLWTLSQIPVEECFEAHKGDGKRRFAEAMKELRAEIEANPGEGWVPLYVHAIAVVTKNDLRIGADTFAVARLIKDTARVFDRLSREDPKNAEYRESLIFLRFVLAAYTKDTVLARKMSKAAQGEDSYLCRYVYLHS